MVKFDHGVVLLLSICRIHTYHVNGARIHITEVLLLSIDPDESLGESSNPKHWNNVLSGIRSGLYRTSMR